MTFTAIERRRLARVGTFFVLTCISVGVGLSSAVHAEQAGTPNAAKLAVVGASPIQVELDDQKDGGPRTGSANVLVSNTGTAPATVQAQVGMHKLSKSCEDVELKAPQRVTVQTNQVEALEVKFEVESGCDNEQGTLVFQPTSSGAAPATTQFQFVRGAEAVNYKLPVWVAAISALALAVALNWKGRDGRKKGLNLGPTWSFNEGWVTSVSALTAILTTVLASTGLLTELLPGISAGRLIGLNILFGGLVLFAPVIYSAAADHEWKRNKDKETVFIRYGRRWGLFFASIVGAGGSVGIVATVGIIVAAADLGPLAKVPTYMGLGGIGLLVLIYAFRWTKAAQAKPPAEDAPEQVATGIATNQCVAL